MGNRSDTVGSLAAWSGNQLHLGGFYSYPAGVSDNRHRYQPGIGPAGLVAFPDSPPALVLIVVGVILGLISRFIPMVGSIKSILNAIVVIAVVLWLLQVFGLLSSSQRYT